MKLNIVVASTFTVRPLEDSLRFYLEQFDIPGEIEFAPYGQVLQALLDPSSALSRNSRGVNFILVRVEDWAQGMSGSDDFAARLESNVQAFVDALSAGLSRTLAPSWLVVCPPSNGMRKDEGAARAIQEAAVRIQAAASTLPDVRFVDGNTIASGYRVSTVNDPVADAAGHVPYTPEYFAAVGATLIRNVLGLAQAPYRAIVLDADDTLWQGVVGEDGPESVAIPAEYLALQEWARECKKRGYKLALASQNDESDVLRVFAGHREMPLQEADWDATEIDWVPVTEKLEDLARRFQLTTRDLVYLSGNPVECARVRAAHPEVLTLSLPRAASEIPAFVEQIWI